MTNEQWTFITAKISMLELIVQSIVRASLHREAIKEQIVADAEIQEAALLHSQISDEQLEVVRRNITQFLQVI